jgi:hypothetical protein
VIQVFNRDIPHGQINLGYIQLSYQIGKLTNSMRPDDSCIRQYLLVN